MEGGNIPLCRLCRKLCDYCINIFDPNGNSGFPVWKIIEELLRLEVCQEDGLPRSICTDCFCKLSEFRNFKTMCMDSRLEFLKNITNTVDKTSLGNPPVTSIKCGEISSAECARKILSDVCGENDPYDCSEDVKPIVLKLDSTIAELRNEGCRDEGGNSYKTIRYENTEASARFVFCEPSSSQAVGHSDDESMKSDEEKSLVEVYDEERENYNDNDTGCYSHWGSRLRNTAGNSVGVSVKKPHRQYDVQADHTKSSSDDGLSTSTGKVQGEGVDLSTNQVGASQSKDELPNPHGRQLEGIPSSSSRPNDGPPYPCPECWLVFSTQSYLKKHKRLAHWTPTPKPQTLPSEAIKGEGTAEDSSNQKELSQDYEDENDTVTVSQDVVGLLEVGMVVPGEGAPDDVFGVCGFVCDLCGASFVDKGSLSQHVSVHIEGKIHECPVCSKRFKWESDLRRHSMAHSNDRPYCCEQCGRCFNQKSSLTKHSYTHTGHRPYKCEFCELRFTQKCFLKSHLLCHSGARPYQCGECHKTFNRKNNLMVHSRIHSDIKPFQCQVCFKKFNSSTGLKRHLMTHTETKPFQCPVCDKSYNYKDTMRRHLLMHVGKQPVHECPICNKKFTHTGNLNVHLRAHSGTKPHKCTECPESFARRDSLQKHLAIHSETKPYQCEQCDKRYKDRSSLYKHVKLTHSKALQ